VPTSSGPLVPGEPLTRRAALGGQRLWQDAARWWAKRTGSSRLHQDYVPFVVVGRSRTGSNFLRGLLGSHPQVIILGEILKNPAAIEWGTERPTAPAQAADVYRQDPVAFLETYVFSEQPLAVRALGFKLFYYHARAEPWARIWPHLQTRPGLHVIHLKRRNILRTHLSRAQAERSDRWVNASGQPEDYRPIELDYSACLRDFEQTRTWEAAADEYFDGQAMLKIYYEDLVEATQRQVDRLEMFLGLPRRTLVPQTHRQARLPLAQAIANYPELQRRFRGSPWEAFFEDEPAS